MARRPTTITCLGVLWFTTVPQWFAFWRGVHASTPCTNATFSWVNNADGLSPCDVCGILVGACDGQTCRSTHPTRAEYLRVRDQLQTPCFCNTLSYSLRAACELCTNVAMQTESEYIASQCDQGLLKTFPCSLLPNVVVPEWAYQDVVDGWFNDTPASQIAIGEATLPSTVSTSTDDFPGATSTIGKTSTTRMLLSPGSATTSAQPTTLGPPSQSIAISAPSQAPEQTTTVPHSYNISSDSLLGGDTSTPATISQQTSASMSSDVSPSYVPHGPDQHTDGSPNKIDPVIGGVTAVVSIALAIIFAAWLIRRRRRRDASVCKDRPPLIDKDEMWKHEPVTLCDDDQPGDARMSSTQVPGAPVPLEAI
ncbi:hypothetical protein C8Q73DRAFT_694635, partial [Cubamyces lactineus]